MVAQQQQVYLDEQHEQKTRFPIKYLEKKHDKSWNDHVTS